MRIAVTLPALVLSFGLAAIGASAGCNKSSSAEPPTPEAGPPDASVSSSDAAATDAGADAEQDPDVYPAKHHPLPQVDDNGGPVLKTPVLVTVTFDYVVIDGGGSGGPGEASAADGSAVDAATESDSATAAGPDPYAPTLEAFGNALLTTAWQKTVDGPYGVGPGKSGGHVRLPDSLGPGLGTVSHASVSDEQIQHLLQAEVTAGALPAPRDQTIYALYFPDSTVITEQGGVSCAQFGAYHSAVGLMDTKGNSVNTMYAVIPRCPAFTPGLSILEQVTVFASHEIAEGSADPDESLGQLGYYLVSNDAWPHMGQLDLGGEIADLCNTATSTPYHTAGFAVQRIWSNNAAAASHDPCEPTDDYVPPRVYYNAAVQTQTIKDTMGYKADGYVVVKEGQSASFLVNVFSAAPLPNDLTFSVGAPSALDWGTLDPLPNGATASVSITTGHNGNAATLDISVPAGTPAGDTFFVVRSTLSQDDYHDWPVLLHVVE
jgi:hypothetical protein